MEKRVAILQSNYIPWKGYFDLINMVDLFVFHDDLQYTKNDWRNRNKILTSRGEEWLTIPCGNSEKRLICEVALNDDKWQKKHWNKICDNYRKSRYFFLYEEDFSQIYLDRKWTNLSELNQYIIEWISKELFKFTTVFDDSRNYSLKFKKAERVLELLEKLGATTYLSGPAAKNYLNERDFDRLGIKLEWMDYSGYPRYFQMYTPFVHEVSILDLIFNCGPESEKYLKSTV